MAHDTHGQSDSQSTPVAADAAPTGGKDAGSAPSDGKAADAVASAVEKPTVPWGSVDPLSAPHVLDEGAYAAERDFINRGYGIIGLRGVHNCRDLGGLPASGTKVIASRRLIRSGELGDATKADAAQLQGEDLRLVVDFRTDDERAHSPEPEKLLPGVKFVHIPVVTASALGVTHEGGLAGLVHEGLEYEHDALGKMVKLYQGIVLSKEGQQGYGRFFQLLLDQEEGSVLWHCTAGKDRTGIAAALITLTLGVPRSMVVESYLASNRYTEPLASKALEALGRKHILPGVAHTVHTLYRVNERFLNGALDAIATNYGSIRAYLDEALGVDADAIETLKARYLVDRPQD